MSVCNGAFSLAIAGLLDGLEATTTAGHLARLQRTFPDLHVVDDRRVVDNGRILATAGLSAGIGSPPAAVVRKPPNAIDWRSMAKPARRIA